MTDATDIRSKCICLFAGRPRLAEALVVKTEMTSEQVAEFKREWERCSALSWRTTIAEALHVPIHIPLHVTHTDRSLCPLHGPRQPRMLADGSLP